MPYAGANPSRLFLLLAVFLSACGVRGRDSADSVASWHLEEVWRRGGEVSGPYSFDAEFGLSLLPGGALVHFDHQEQQFHLLDQDGDSIGTFGRKGAGPGELLNANGFVVGPNGMIVVNDRGNNRFALFDQHGVPAGEIPVPWTFSAGVRWDARFLDDGRLVERKMLATDTGWRDETRLWTTALDSSEVLPLDTCMVSPRPGGGAESRPIVNGDGERLPRQYVPIPFSGPWTATAIDPRGFVWGQPADRRSAIERFGLTGCASTATIELPDSTAAIPQAMLDSAVAVLRSAAATIGGQLPADLRLPTRFPSFFTVHVDRLRRVWVQGFGEGGLATMQVFDSVGAPLARIDSFPLATRAPLIFTEDRVYGFETDDSGIKYLVALRVVR